MTQASHHRTARRRHLLRCTAVGMVMALAGFKAHAQPGPASSPASVAAAPTITVNGSTTDVTLNQSRTLIDWSSFNIGKDETVNFRFGAGKDIVLNRIGGVANIDGALNGLVGNQVGGNVWLYSPSGVVFGANARVNVGGLLATTSPLLSESDFLNGSGALTFKGGPADASVLVRDGARLTSAGALALLAPSVATQAGATVTANGTVLYGAAENFRIRFDASAGSGFDLIEFEVPTSALEDGTVSATPLAISGSTTGSNVIMAAVSRPSVMNALISIEGTVTARSAIQGQGGEIILSASGAPSKTVIGAGGVLDAASTGAGLAGGRVAIESPIIDVHGAIDASGPSGGGAIRIGGGFQGKDASIANAQGVFVGAGARLTADATASGDGGEVVIWSDRWTGFNGHISARGGLFGGNGGQAEVSSKGWLGYGGLADLRAPGGRVGRLLLDPAEIRIVSGVTAAPATNNYTPGAGVATTDLGTATIFTQLALGDLTISTDSASTGGDGQIEFVNGLNYIGAVSSNVLTLNAENGFVFTDPAPIRASGLGGFNVVLNAGAAAFDSGSAVIDPRGSVSDGSVSITGAGINVGGALNSGAVTLVSTGGAITQGAAITATGAFSATTAGDASDITLTSANKLSTVSALGGANIALVNDQAMTVTAAGVTGAGTLDLTTTTGALTLTGALTRGASITLDSAGALTAGAVTASSGDLSMTGSTISFGGSVEATAGDVTLETTGGQLSLTQSVTTGASGIATLTSSADIAQSAVITAGTVTGSSVGGATLTQANVVDNIGAFTNTGGGDIDFTSTAALTVVGAVTNTAGGPGAIDLQGASLAVDGALSAGSVGLTATAGAITQSATITTTSGFSAEATGGAVTLTTSGNKIGGAISALQGATVSLKNDQATSIAAGDINSAGAVSLETTTGALTVTGALNQPGTISLTAAGTLSADAVRATTGNVAMKGSTITFGGAVRSDAGSVSLETTSGTLALTQTVTAGTSTTLKGSSGITQTAIVTTSGLSVDGGTGDVVLTNANKIGGNLNGIAGVNVSVTNDQALSVIPNVSATGDVTLITTTGGLTVSGGAIGATGDLTLTAAGALNLDSGASSSAGDLSLKGTSLNFVNPGSLSAAAGDVSIETTGGALTLDRNVTASGAGVVTLKSSGAINQTAGAITGGTVTGSSVGGATLTGAGNAISNLDAFTNTTSGAIALVTVNDLAVTAAVTNTPGAINLTGESVSVDAALNSGAGASSLTATNGSITQSAAITAVGFSAQATGGATTLGGANQISGTVGTLRGQAITFNNGQATTILGVTVDAGGTGAVSLSTTAGNLTVPGISTAGTIDIDAAGAVLGNPNLTSTSGSINVTSAGASMDLGALSAASATGDVILNANGEDISFSSIVAGRDVSLSGEDITTAGTVTLGRDYTLVGESFSAGVFAPVGGVPRDFSITDTLGGFTGSNITAARNLTITATDAGSNAPISLTDVSTATGSLTVNGSSITLAGAINVGSRALSLTANQGAVTQSGGTITAGTVSGSSVTGFSLNSTSNAIAALGAISNTTSGDLVVQTSTALDLTANLTATGQLVQVVGLGGPVTQSGGVITGQQLNIGGGSVTATRNNAVNILRVITTAGDGVVNNSQAVRLDASSATGGNLTITAAGNISVNGAVTAGAATGSQSVELVATGSGAITDTATGSIVAGVLKGSSGGGFTLDNAANNIGRLQDITDTSATGITYKDSGGTLNVANLSAINGPISLSAVGNLVVDGTVTGSTSTTSPTNFVSTGGAVSQTVGGVITAGRVTGSAATGFNLAAADNVIGELGAVTNTTSGGVALRTTTALAVPGAISAPGQTVALTSSGTITQTGAGVITAGALNATGAGGLTFGGANQLAAATLTSTGAGDISLTNVAATGLTVSASTTGDITLRNNGDLTLGNIVTGPATGPQTASFTSVNGAIGQSAGTGITAGTVTGSAAGVLDLTTSTTNAVSRIGAFSTTGSTGAGLVSTVALSIDGAVSGGTGFAVFAAPGLTLSSTGSITSSGPASGVNLISTGAGNALTLQGDITTGDYVGLTSAGVITQTAGTIIGAGVEASAVGGINLSAVDAATLIGLDNSGSGDIVVTDTATAVAAGAVTNTAGKVIISTPNGSLGFSGAVQGSGDVTLTALTALSGTTARSTGGALSLSGAPVNFSGVVAGAASAMVDGHGSNVTLGGLNSGTGDATVTGAAIAINGPVTIGRDYILTGASFNAGALSPSFAAGTGRDFIITDTFGGLAFTNLAAPRDLTIVATSAAPGDTAQISGSGLSSTIGKITVTGTRITLTGAVTAPAGDIALTSTVGGIGLSGAVTAAANKVTLASAATITESGAGAITAARLSATAVGGIAMAGANNAPIIDNLTNNGAGGIVFRNSAPTTTLTAVTTGSGDIDVQSTGAIALPNAVTAPAGLRIVAGGALSGVSTSAAATTLGGNGVSFTSVASTGATTVQGGAGLVTIGSVSSGAGALTVTGGPIQLTTATSGQTATINGAGNVALGTVTATDALVVKGGPVQITAAMAGTTAEVTSSNTLDVATLTAGQAAALQASGALTAGAVTATGGDLTLKGAGVTLTSGSAGRDGLVTATGGNVQIGDLAAARDLKLSATGDIGASLVTVGRDLDAQAGGDLNLRRIVSGPAGNLTLGGRDVVVGAPTGATPGVGDTLTGGVVSITATRDASVNVSGNVNLALLKAGRDARLSTLNGDATAASVQAGNMIAVNTQNGSAAVGSLTLGAGGTSATLTATNDVTLGAAVGATPTAGQVISVPITATLTLDGGRDVTVNLATGARIDTLKAGRDVNVSVATGDLTTATTTAGRNARLAAAAGAVTATTATATGGDLVLLGRAATLATGQAGGSLAVRATAQDARVTNATGGAIAVTADAGAAGLKTARLTGPGTLTVTAGGAASLGRLPGEATSVTPGALDVPAGATVTVKGATALVDLTGAANLTRVEATAGDATVRATGAVVVAANGVAPNGVVASGAVNVTGATGVTVSGATAGGVVNLVATTGGVTSGLTKGTVVTVTAPGAITLAQTTASGAFTATGQTVSIGGGTQVGGGMTLTANGGAVTAADAVNVTGDLMLKATGGATVSGVATASGKAQVLATGPISVNSLTGDTVLLRGSDLNLTGNLRATKACSPTCADPTLVVESAEGGLNLGDASADAFPTAPMSISKSEFSRIRGAAVTLYAGDTTNAAKRGEVRIGDLDLDITQVNTLMVLAGPANTVQVTGAVLPGAGGGGNLVIGGADASKGWTPRVIYVTGDKGGLGGGAVNGILADQKPLKSVTLNAVDDVLLGSPTFIAAINQALDANAVAAINIIRNTPAGVQARPSDLNRALLVADTLTVRANGVVVQQNTSFVGNQTGIILTNRDQAGTIATFGRTSPAGASGVTPQLIDLSLAYFNTSGALIGRSVVAASPTISLSDLSRSESYRINGCTIGVGGACTPLPNTLVDVSIGKLVEGVQLTTQDAPPTYDPTITGAGNEEIWRSNDCNQEDDRCR